MEEHNRDTTSLLNTTSRRGLEQTQQQQLQQNVIQDARFSCSICHEAVIEPVVTQCGHLYCWPCLYQWLEPGMTPVEREGLTGYSTPLSTPYDPSKRVCPLCRTPCSVKRVVPIYVRTDAASIQRPNHNHRSPLIDEIQFYPTAFDNNHDDDNNNNDDEDRLALSEDEDDDQYPTTGLRQRTRFRSTDSEIPMNGVRNNSPMMVPRRPAAHAPSTPTNHHATNAFNNDNDATTPQQTLRHNNNNNYNTSAHPASLSNGLLPLVQVVQEALLRRATSGSADTNMLLVPRNHQHFVPGLDRLQGMQQQQQQQLINNNETSPTTSMDPNSPDFLQWLLLLLGSFVLLCLLWF